MISSNYAGKCLPWSLCFATNRTRFMQVQVEIARRNERVTSKNNRARAEAAAATRLQWIARGCLQRCRFKVNLGASVSCQMRSLPNPRMKNNGSYAQGNGHNETRFCPDGGNTQNQSNASGLWNGIGPLKTFSWRQQCRVHARCGFELPRKLVSGSPRVVAIWAPSAKPSSEDSPGKRCSSANDR